MTLALIFAAFAAGLLAGREVLVPLPLVARVCPLSEGVRWRRQLYPTAELDPCTSMPPDALACVLKAGTQ